MSEVMFLDHAISVASGWYAPGLVDVAAFPDVKPHALEHPPADYDGRQYPFELRRHCAACEVEKKRCGVCADTSPDESAHALPTG